MLRYIKFVGLNLGNTRHHNFFISRNMLFWIMKNLIILILLIVGCFYNAIAQDKIAAKEALKHIGENVIIYDKVYGTKFLQNSNNIQLYIGNNYPHQFLTVIVKKVYWSQHMVQSQAELSGRSFCITGKLLKFNGRPVVEVTESSQLKPLMIDNVSPIYIKVR